MMNKKLLHQSAKNLILNVNYADMEDMLTDYQDFLTQDENQSPLEDNSKNISISFTTIVSIIAIILLLIPVMLAFMLVETSFDTQFKLTTQLVIGAVIPLVTYLIFNKKVKLLSKFYEPKKNEKIKAFLLSMTPVLVTIFTIISKLILAKYEAYHLLNFHALTTNISIALLFALLLYSLNKFLKTSNIYFNFFNMSYISMIIIAQVNTMNSTMTSVEVYYSFYNYTYVLLAIGTVLSIVIAIKDKNKEN